MMKLGKMIEESYEKGNGSVVDMKLTINGLDFDIEQFINSWVNSCEKAFKQVVKEHADEIISNKFDEISDLLSDLRKRIKPEIEKRKEDWERNN